MSIYILPEYHGAGVAHALYDRLFSLLEAMGCKNAYAAYTEPNEKSRKFHRKFGFKTIGTHHNTSYRFGAWHDVTWMEKSIGNYAPHPERVWWINEIPHGPG